jgi:hypothetical protein
MPFLIQQCPLGFGNGKTEGMEKTTFFCGFDQRKSCGVKVSPEFGLAGAFQERVPFASLGASCLTGLVAAPIQFALQWMLKHQALKSWKKLFAWMDSCLSF